MKPNSNGSVTPQTNEQIAAEATSPIATFFLLLLAVWIIARAAPGIPNIIHGKNPDIYIPKSHVTSADVSPAQKCCKSPSPIVSNQNTLFSA